MKGESTTLWCGILISFGMLVVLGCEPPPDNEGTDDNPIGSGGQPLTLIEPTPEMLANEYVPTPGGQRVHRSCVYEVENRGTPKQESACAYKPGPTESATAAMTDAASDVPDPTISWAWYAYSYKTTPASPGWYDGASALWSVPNNPAHDDGQTLYYFPGFQNTTGSRTTIIQPVLGYHGGTWSIASWWGPDASGNYYHSPFITVYPGDTLSGHMYGDSCTSAGVCTWDISTIRWVTGESTTMTINTGFTYDWAAPWVEEVYSITRCSNFPSNSPISAQTQLFVGPNNVQDTGTWSHTTYSSTSPNCRPRVTISPNPGTTSIAQWRWP